MASRPGRSLLRLLSSGVSEEVKRAARRLGPGLELLLLGGLPCSEKSRNRDIPVKVFSFGPKILLRYLGLDQNNLCRYIVLDPKIRSTRDLIVGKQPSSSYDDCLNQPQSSLKEMYSSLQRNPYGDYDG